MLKFILYVAFFIFFGYFYGKMTEGTVFDNFFILLLFLFIVLFVSESIFSQLKKRKQQRQSDIDAEEGETFNEIFKEIANEFEKTWKIKYNEHIIEIMNKYNREELYVNGKLVAEKQRGGWLSWLKPYHLLTATIEENGTRHEIVVKIGGFITLNCSVSVNKQLIFKDKIKYDLRTGEQKDKENE